MFTRLQFPILIATACLATAPVTAQTTLHDNGPVANSVGTGVGGADENILQTSLGLTAWGFGVQVSANSTIADDFTITDTSGWQVDEVVVYAYQTGSGITSTITDARIRIWAGDPTAGGVVVFGDLLTNRLVSSVWSNTYRVDEATSGVATNRPIMAITASVGALLGPGTYWLEFQAAGSGASGPFGPPLVITGQAGGGNGLQTIFGGPFIPMNNNGNVLDMPFRVEGNVAGITSFCTAKSTSVCGAASISASGLSSATATSGFVVSAAPTRGCRSGLLLYSNQPIAPGVSFGGPGDGLLCLTPAGLRRAGPIESGGTAPSVCDGVMAIDLNSFRGLSWAATGCAPPTGQTNPAGFLGSMGTMVNTQMWGRDSVSTGQVLSDGLSFTVGP